LARYAFPFLIETSRFRASKSTSQENQMTINVIAIQPLIALIAGILILVIPRLLNIIVALYLIIIGLTGLWPRLMH
jgi:hypothetical protein